MAEIVEVVGLAGGAEYPIVTSQILCMHSRLPYEVNKAIVDLAAQSGVCLLWMWQEVIAITQNAWRICRTVRMRSLGINTTGHSTPSGVTERCLI